MIIKICKSKEEVGNVAASLYAAQVIKNPTSVLGLATGSSVLPTYQAMIRDCQNNLTDYSKVTTFNLDEYCGLAGTHEQSYRYFMTENLFKHINISTDKTHVLNGTVDDYDSECAAYEVAITNAGGIDLQLLGIGHNGHIAFNEPADSFSYSTQCVQLTDSTIQANSRFFETIDEVPQSALSMGIGTIMRAKNIVMVVTGADKAQAVYNTINGPITPQCPASILQLHPNTTIIMDEAAASML